MKVLKETNEIKIYSSTDLYLSAFLLCHAPLVSVGQDAHKIVFNFKHSLNISALIQKYFDATAMVTPLQYKKNLSFLREEIMARR